MNLRRLRLAFVMAWILVATAMVAVHAAEEGPRTNLPAARVVVAQDSTASAAFIPDPAAVRKMVTAGLTRFASKENESEAWNSLVGPSDVVGIKVVSSPGPMSGTRPAVVEALVEGLIAAGHPPRQIIIWDKQSHFLNLSGYYALAERLGVRCISAVDAGWDTSAKAYENPLLGRPLFGDAEFGKKGEGVGRKSHITTLLTKDITKLISVAPVLSQTYAGVYGHIVSLGLGSVDNTLRFELSNERLAETVPELAALPEVFDKLILAVSDALLCQYRGDERTMLHYSVALNEIRFSKDPVALDVLALADVERSRKRHPTQGEKPLKTDLYSNAALLELGVADTNQIRVVSAP